MKTDTTNTTADTSTSERPAYLVGMDGSKSSQTALGWAVELAQLTGARVDALIAWSVPPTALVPTGFGGPIMPLDEIERGARNRLKASVASTVPQWKDNVNRIVAVGSPGTALSERSSNYDLVIVGRTGRGWVSRLLSGSTARHVARHASCPVALIDASPSPLETITVAVDGSPHSVHALRWAAELPQVDTITAMYAHDERVMADFSVPQSVWESFAERARELLTETITAAAPNDPRIEGVVRVGDPRTVIVDESPKNGTLVVGAPGYSGATGVLLGSLTNYAVDHAPGSLIVWRGRG